MEIKVTDDVDGAEKSIALTSVKTLPQGQGDLLSSVNFSNSQALDLPSTSQHKSRSNSPSPEKCLLKNSVHQILPPSANQALRTAMWVNSVTNESTSNESALLIQSKESKQTPEKESRPLQVVTAEINHNTNQYKAVTSPLESDALTMTNRGENSHLQHNHTIIEMDYTTTQV